MSKQRWLPKVRTPGAAVLLIAAGALPATAQTQTIVQRGRAFHPDEVAIKAGDSLAFANQDEFIHQIYVKSDAMTFDSDEQSPGQNVVVKFNTPGTFPVRCHIHPKMQLTVHVK